MANRPEPEVDVTTELVQRLIDVQFPQLSAMPIRELSRGWDNTNLRLGDELIVRVPHRQVAVELILNEQRWLLDLEPQLDLAIPAPLHVGRPTDFYPWPWSITRWFAGGEAASAALTNEAETAATLGRFLAQLHVAAPVDAPRNPYRGCPLDARADSFETRLAHLDDSGARAAISQVFRSACAVPATMQRVWLHGDLHTRNMVVDNGVLAAVIDWGDICAGDRATDLAAAFMLVPNHIDLVARHAKATDDDWRRALGWAANFAVVYLAHSDDDPVMHAMGTRLFDVVLAAPD